LTGDRCPGDARPVEDASTRAGANPFGILEALFGIAAGFLLSSLAATAYGTTSGRGAGATIGSDIVTFVALWAGFLGAVVVATRWHAPGRPVAAAPATGSQTPGRSGSAPIPALSGTGRIVDDYGLRLRPWPDLPLGIAVGVAAQFGLVPLLELPLQPFVHNLSRQIGHPTRQLLGPVNGTSFVILTVFVCLGSPLVEELFFRGLLLRGLLGKVAGLGRRAAPAFAIVATGLVFGLVHFEPLQFLGLAGFGMVLSYLAYRTGRLGPSIVAHISFNTTTVVAYALTHSK
jgi:membrane protease YdiL (CAAX protease family)